MGELARYVEYVNLALYTLVAVVGFHQLRAGRGRAALWAALTFGSLALVADVGRVLPENPMTDFEEVALRFLVAILVLFPYFLYRFTTAFRPPTRMLERCLGLMTVVLLVWTFALPDFPQGDEPRSAGFIAYLIAFVVHWTVLSIVVATQLWRARRGQPGVARRRMALELRTPVATIHGIVETLHRHGKRFSEAQLAPLERTLLQQSSRMRSLVDQLLDLSRLDAEAVPIAPERFHLRERVEEIVHAAAGGQEDEVEIAVAPDLEAVVDKAAFDRIISNLVVNAFRYGAPPVRITAERRDRHLRLRVEDRGSGVPTEFVPDLFERFTRDRDTVDRAGGTGLGLAIARSYANAHGGDLVYSPARPQGALFELVLPQSDEVRARGLEPPRGYPVV